MHVLGFLQNYNGVSNGDLRRCLTSMALVAEPIFVYDDCSTENVRPVYEEFDCIVIYGLKNEFGRELFHKDQLLRRALGDYPTCDWICWFDSDAVLGSFFEDRDRVHDALEEVGKHDLVQVYLHNLNLWRSLGWYRTDTEYNNLWHCVFWKNTGQLHYNPTAGLHQKQFPIPFYPKQEGGQVSVGAIRFQDPEQRLLHWGFAEEERIVEKYRRYKSEGQTGYPLDRLVSEKGLALLKADKSWFPKFCRPKGRLLKPRAGAFVHMTKE